MLCASGLDVIHHLGDVANHGLLCSRRCGYSKAKQDPEEEKMHFHNGHSKQTVKKKKKKEKEKLKKMKIKQSRGDFTVTLASFQAKMCKN